MWDSNLIDPEQEDEANKLKKVKKDSKNLGKKKTGVLTAAEKLRRLQRKRREANKEKEESRLEKDKENDSLASNTPQYEAIAEDLAGMMDKITVQLDIITRTIVTLSKRIGDTEQTVNEAFHQYELHKKNAEIREKLELAREADERAKNAEQNDEPKEETKEPGYQPSTVMDLEETREKAKNIMNIINISQYSLAAVSKSAQEIRENTQKMQQDLSPVQDLGMEDPIVEDSEEDLERDIPISA